MTVDDPAVQRVIDLTVAETDIEALLTGLIRVALGRRTIIEEAREECVRLAAEGSDDHAAAVVRLDRALSFRNLWGA